MTIQGYKVKYKSILFRVRWNFLLNKWSCRIMNLSFDPGDLSDFQVNDTLGSTLLSAIKVVDGKTK